MRQQGVALPQHNCPTSVFQTSTVRNTYVRRNRSRDSVLHRLDRTSAVQALEELQRQGLPNDLATDVPNPKVDAVLQRMVSTATELPKVGRMKSAKAAALLPELFDAVISPRASSQ